jgi:hypothetical protein
MTFEPQTVDPIDPNVADLMGRAFDTAWTRLATSDSTYAGPGLAEDTREKIALKIIELAGAGERELDGLVQRALAELGFVPGEAPVDAPSALVA